MRTATLLSLVMLQVAILFSCKNMVLSKKQYLKKFEAFVEEVKEHYKQYSEEEWSEKDETYEKFAGELYDKYKPRLTPEEKDHVNQLKGKYKTYRNLAKSKGFWEDVKESMDEGVEQLKGVLDAIEDVVTDTTDKNTPSK